DPEHPACLEVGIRNELLKSVDAKTSCLTFMQSLLSDAGDRSFLSSLKREKDLQKRDGLTFEITPETSEDAYGGWWVSVYDEKLLDSSRASDAELKAITLPTEEIKKAPQVATPDDWGAGDLRYARPAANPTGGGAVYVRGYTRKDGTYVQPHTRSA